MKKITKIILTVLVIVAVILPLLFPIAALVTPTVYHESFVHSLDEKIERLKSIEEEKIVIIGGSSVAFGIDSEIIERNTGMPVVNFGLYAALGTKLMLDLALPHIKEGDIVIVAPELDAQTLSLYFNAGTTLRALDGSLFPTVLDIPSEHYGTLLGASWDYTLEKLSYLLGDAPQYNGIYSASSFNEYGDVKSGIRPNNVMPRHYDTNQPISLTADILDPEFKDYLNNYAEHCRDKGASVMFSWCPLNELAITTSESDIAAFESYMENSLDVKFISYLSDYIFPANYFYDTNFHLNDSGARLRTLRLLEDLLIELGDTREVKDTPLDMPELPKRGILFDGVDENDVYFEYTLLQDGSYAISRVKDEYKNMTELTLPLGYDGYKVTSVGANAFSGTAVNKIVIPEATNIRILENDAFRGAGELREIWILFKNEAELVPPDNFRGTRSDLVIYVPEGTGYQSGYYWSQRNLTFKIIK